jgi:type IV pilus assembly protein PilB
VKLPVRDRKQDSSGWVQASPPVAAPSAPAVEAATPPAAPKAPTKSSPANGNGDRRVAAPAPAVAPARSPMPPIGKVQAPTQPPAPERAGKPVEPKPEVADKVTSLPASGPVHPVEVAQIPAAPPAPPAALHVVAPEPDLEPKPASAVKPEPESAVKPEPASSPPAAPGAPPVDGSPRLGDLLIAHKLIEPEQLAAALLRQTTSGQVLGKVLVEQGFLTESDLLTSLAHQLGLEKVDLGRVTPDGDAIAAVAEQVARSYRVVPLRLDGQMVEVVTSDPKADLAGALAQAIGRPVRLLVAPGAQVQQAIDSAYRTVDAIEALARGYEKAEAARPEPQTGSLADLAPSAPVVQVVNLVITQALRDRASDVHIEPQFDGIRVRFRIDGTLHEVLDLPLEMGPALISRLKILGGMNIVERRRPQDGQIAMEIEGRSIDIRVATVATVTGEKCVLRILDKSRPLFKLQDLGMPAQTYETFSKLIRAPFGMVISAGPTGSGKTTSLYAALSDINSPDRNITTVEDPVEYLFPSLNQIQVNEQAGLTFADGLKSILRQDPDVILVGEVRDAETARIAVQSALTGHLVLSSFHATDTPAALHRLLDMGIESFLVASAVTAVVAQRLLRRVCTNCRVPYLPTEEEMIFYRENNGPEEHSFYVGNGCNFCSGTGYRDRVGVYELLRITPELRRLIVGWATQEEIRRTAKAQGMRTLQDEGLRLVADGVTTTAEVIRGLYAGV